MKKPLLLALALPLLLGGCYVHGRGEVAYAAYDPPPPRYVYADYRPGYVWVNGYWNWNRDRYHWRNGYYVAERPGYHYVQSSWRGRRYQPGHWQRGRAVSRPAARGHGHRHGGNVRYVAPSRPARLHVIPPRKR
jgi:hypothetical protein